jgi:hypothetical protein
MRASWAASISTMACLDAAVRHPHDARHLTSDGLVLG